MPFDDQLRDSLDRLVAGLRAHLEADVRTCSDELSRAAAGDRQRVADEAAAAAAATARADVQLQIAQLREARRENDEFRRGAEARIADLARAGETLQAEIEAARRDVESVRAERDAARAEVQETARQAEALRRAAHEEAEEVLAAQLALAAADHKEKLEAALENARAARHDAETAAATRLLTAVRGLDATRTLGEVLDVLTHCGAREAERAAVLIVKGNSLQGWRFDGFTSTVQRPSQVTMTLDEAGIAGSVVRSGAAAAHGAPSETAPALPRFAQDAGERYATALPVHVGERVVAVLYADAPCADTTPAMRWAAVLEVVTRHASRVLEARTLQQAVGLAPVQHGPVEVGKPQPGRTQ